MDVSTGTMPVFPIPTFRIFWEAWIRAINQNHQSYDFILELLADRKFILPRKLMQRFREYRQKFTGANTSAYRDMRTWKISE